MYEPFFGLQRRPFSATPDSSCFFACESVQAALDELIVCIERGQGIGLLVAPAGMGKSLLCQRLAAEVADRFEVVCLGTSTFPTRRSLLQAILFEMGDEYSRKDESELRLDLRSRLMSLRPEKEAVVLIIDETHLLSDELLEEIRTLSDVADAGSPLVRLILGGQPELEERLTSRTFDALNQRISNQVYLESLSLTESRDYLAHRLEWAGASLDSVFVPDAVDVIARASDGVARCLNQLADHCLLLAFASDEQPVGRQTVLDALEDLKQLPLHWNDVSGGESVVGWQDDEQSELPSSELEVAEADVTDAPPHVAMPGEETDVVPTDEPHSENVDDQSAAPPQQPVAEVAPAVIEFGGPSETPQEVAVEPTVETVEMLDVGASAETAEEETQVGASSDAHEDASGLSFEITSDGCALSFETRDEPLVESEVPEAAEETVETSAVYEVQEIELPSPVDHSEGDEVSIVVAPHSVSPADVVAETPVADSEPDVAADDVVDEAPAETTGNGFVPISVADVDGDEFEEEVVIDHYSAIAEPQSTGIIWNLIGSGDAQHDAVDTVPEAESLEEEAGEPELKEDPAGVDVEEAHTEEEHASDEQEVATFEFSAPIAEADSDVEAEAVSDDVIEPAAEIESDEPHETLSILAAEEVDQDTLDVLSLRPDDRIDAIVPLLDEIGEVARSSQSDAPERSLLDIEAELVQNMEYGQPEIEDEIGAAILDMCLDAQADIREAREQQEADASEDDDYVSSEESEHAEFAFDAGPFDIVEPEDEGLSSYRFDAPVSDETPESSESEVPPPGTKSRPFGRLFSELRRRQRQVG